MVSFNNIPLLMVVAFLLLTLVVGVYFSRKTTIFREYAVGNKQFTTVTLVTTVLATCFSGGGLLRSVEMIYSQGLSWIVVLLLYAFLGFWVVSWLAVRMAPFMQNLSIPDTIGHVYGKSPRVIAALSGICTAVAVVTSQIYVMSQSLIICSDSVHPGIITVLSTLILIFYSIFGGIRAIAFTDVLQFVTFSMIIPLLAWFIYVNIGKPAVTVLSILQHQEKFQFSSLFCSGTKLVGMVGLLLSSVASSISPSIMQRVYMSSGPIQAQRVFFYSGLFSFILAVSIILIGLFVVVGAPALPIAGVWHYVMTHIPPVFKGLVAISLLAMAMSTADSYLNACAVMVSHDMLESIRGVRAASYIDQLPLARLTVLVVGLCAMILSFYCNDLLQLLYWALDVSVPIMAAPMVLAIFGFRGTTRTALIGMATGALAIFIWNQWVKPATAIDGAFVCMVANGLAMMVAHYQLPQPKGAGWVGLNDAYKQVQQAKARKNARRKAAIKHAFAHKKETLAKLRPSEIKLVLVGLYIIITAIMNFWTLGPNRLYWVICQSFVGILFGSYAIFASYKTFCTKQVPDWIIGLCWFIGLAFCLPINVLWHWWHVADPIFTPSLSLVHCSVTLLVLPLYLGIVLVVVTLLAAIYPIYSIGWLWSLLPLLLGILLVLAIMVYLKIKLDGYISQILYLKNQAKLRENQEIKQRAYNATIVPSAARSQMEEDGLILGQILGDVKQSISFLDSDPIHKQDFQSILNKLYEWAIYFKKQARVQAHILLQPSEITLDKLIDALETALVGVAGRSPRLLIEKIDPNGTLPPTIVCDVNQTIQLLVTAILRLVNLNRLELEFVKFQLHPTQLIFEKGDSIQNDYPPVMVFPSIALVFSNSTTPPEGFPKVDSHYEPIVDDIESKEQCRETASKIDLQRETIQSITHAHYGYLSYPKNDQSAMLVVLPTDVSAIRDEMITKLPMECLTSESAITPKEQGDSLMVLMEFHDYVCGLSHSIDPISPGIIASTLLLLRQRFGVKRHASGQLFYLRAVGITRIVAEWIFHSPKPIYASLLYELVRYTRLPLSYIKAHYNLGVYVFVQNVLGVDKHQELDHPSLFYVRNRFKEAIAQDHVQLSVLFIKLAERLYDLRHAEGYIHLEEVKYMANETLTVDIHLAKQYLDPEIAAALEVAAKQALGYLEKKNNKLAHCFRSRL